MSPLVAHLTPNILCSFPVATEQLGVSSRIGSVQSYLIDLRCLISHSGMPSVPMVSINSTVSILLQRRHCVHVATK